jgi:anti-anti-sigma factor
MLAIDNAGGILWLSGNVMPSEEKRLNEALRQYIQQTNKEDRVVDMSAVKYISSSAAKTLLTVAQESAARGGKLKVRSSIPVVRTLSLLGAETWCEVEPCREPNRKPGSTTVSGSKIMPAKRDSSTKITPAKRDSGTQIAPAGADSTATPPPLEEEHREVFTERRSSVGLNAPGTSAVRSALGKGQSEDPLVKTAAAKAGLPLVNEDADLPDDLVALKKLVVMKTYAFQMPGLKSDITGKVLARVGGPWILIDTHGAKKMVNIREVAVIDILA